MALNQFPYSDFHEMNLDWILKTIKNLASEVERWEVVNKISYQGAWDITKQYASWSIVAVNGTEGYISVQPVPAGIDYTNTDYWRLVADFTEQLAGLGQRVTDLENTIPAIKNTISNNTWLDGKKIVWYGDSWGTTANNLVGQFIRRYPNVSVTNRCIGGTAMSRLTFSGYETNSGYQRITTEDLSGFDYIFIMYGVNDWQVSQKMKTSSPNEYEYLYCVEETIKYLINNYPNLKPVFILESFCYASAGFSHSGLDGVNLVGCTQQAYINNCIDICNRYNIPYINLYDLVGVNRYNYTHYMRNDSGAYVHPNAALFSDMANIIYKGIINTGKVYGDSWGGNIIKTSIPENTMDYSAYLTTIEGIPNFPKRLVNTSDVHSLVFTDNYQDKMIVHITGYREDSSSTVLGMYYDSHNVDKSNVRTFLGNILSAGYFDSYIEVDRKDMFAPCFLLNSNSMVVYGIECRILNGSPICKTEYATPAGSGVTITNSSKPIIEDGTINYKYIRFTADSNISAYSTIITGLPKYFANEAIYIDGYDQNTGNPVNFYLYNNTIRTETNLTSGHPYIIRDFSYKVPV